MSKQLTMWCVFDDNGKPIPEAISRTKGELLKTMTYIGGYPRLWRQYVECWGYTCRKVRVVIEEVKP